MSGGLRSILESLLAIFWFSRKQWVRGGGGRWQGGGYKRNMRRIRRKINWGMDDEATGRRRIRRRRMRRAVEGGGVEDKDKGEPQGRGWRRQQILRSYPPWGWWQQQNCLIWSQQYHLSLGVKRAWQLQLNTPSLSSPSLSGAIYLSYWGCPIHPSPYPPVPVRTKTNMYWGRRDSSWDCMGESGE